MKVALLTSPGIAPITASELALLNVSFKEPRTVFLRNHDLLIGDLDAKSLRAVFKLRTVEDVFLIVNDLPPLKDKTQLGKIVPRGFKELVLQSIPYLPKRKSKGVTTSFAVFVKQDHDHDIYRKQIASTITNAVEANFARWKTKDPAEVEFWAFLSDSGIVFGVRLTRSTFRERNYREDDRVASLRPTIAAALVVLSQPTEGERVLDPMCGTGTILLERHRFAAPKGLTGYDLDGEAITSAQSSAKKVGVEIDFVEADSLKADASAGSFDKIICNLPFGKSFSSPDQLPKLYENAISVWKELLSDQGEMTLLTSEPFVLEKAARKAGLFPKQIAKLRVKGLKTSVVQITR